MQDIREESLNESVKSEQSPRVVLWEIDLTVQGGERYFFCNELNEKGEPVTWQGRQYQAYPIDGSGFEMSGKGSSARPSLTVSNLFGLVTGMAGIANLCCLAIQHWHFVSGCARKAFSLKCSKTNRKIILVHCC